MPGFSSTARMPARIRPAPDSERAVQASPANAHAVSPAKTGSEEKIKAALVAVVWRWAQVYRLKDRAVARTAVIASAIVNLPLGTRRGVSTHQKLARESRPTPAT